MTNTWTRLEDGTWGAKVTSENGDRGYGMGVTLVSTSGRKSQVVLGEFIRSYRIKGGTVVSVYRVATEAEKQEINEDYAAHLAGKPTKHKWTY